MKIMVLCEKMGEKGVSVSKFRTQYYDMAKRHPMHAANENPYALVAKYDAWHL